MCAENFMYDQDAVLHEKQIISGLNHPRGMSIVRIQSEMFSHPFTTGEGAYLVSKVTTEYGKQHRSQCTSLPDSTLHVDRAVETSISCVIVTLIM